MFVPAMIRPGQHESADANERDPPQADVQMFKGNIHVRSLKVKMAAHSRRANTPTDSATKSQSPCSSPPVYPKKPNSATAIMRKVSAMCLACSLLSRVPLLAYPPRRCRSRLLLRPEGYWLLPGSGNRLDLAQPLPWWPSLATVLPASLGHSIKTRTRPAARSPARSGTSSPGCWPWPGPPPHRS